MVLRPITERLQKAPCSGEAQAHMGRGGQLGCRKTLVCSHTPFTPHPHPPPPPLSLPPTPPNTADMWGGTPSPRPRSAAGVPYTRMRESEYSAASRSTRSREALALRALSLPLLTSGAESCQA